MMMPDRICKLAAVYGTSRDVPKTYVLRPAIDDRFVNDITRDKHIIIHGGSKQGKTCLRKYHLQNDDHIVVQCTRETTKAGLYEMILKRAEIPCEVSDSVTLTGMRKLHATVDVQGGIPFFGKEMRRLTPHGSST
jgi:hypothetical protein